MCPTNERQSVQFGTDFLQHVHEPLLTSMSIECPTFKCKPGRDCEEAERTKGREHRRKCSRDRAL